MAQENVGYGYGSDEPTGSVQRFGLNAGAARLIKFEWINNAGKDGAEAEALDIQFSIEGSDRPINHRLFPVTKAFAKDQTEITDPKAPEFQKVVKDFNAAVTHVLHCFVDIEAIKQGFSSPISGFKDFCKVAMSLLPKDFEKTPLDIFFQYQWQIKEGQPKTWLELPRKMAYGKWLSKAVEPVGGEWKEMKHPSPEANTPIALKYVDADNNVHPFVRNGWFMLSNFATQQIAEVTSMESNSPPATEGEAAASGGGW